MMLLHCALARRLTYKYVKFIQSQTTFFFFFNSTHISMKAFRIQILLP